MRYSTLALLPALAAASPVLQVGTIHKDAAPVLSTTNAEAVPDSYMIVFKKHVKDADAASHHDWVQSVHAKSNDERMELRKRSQFPLTTEVFDGLKHTYNIVGGLMGYSGHFDEETLEQIRRHPDVSTRPSPSGAAFCERPAGRSRPRLSTNSTNHHAIWRNRT
jgi:cerevisin